MSRCSWAVLQIFVRLCRWMLRRRPCLITGCLITGCLVTGSLMTGCLVCPASVRRGRLSASSSANSRPWAGAAATTKSTTAESLHVASAKASSIIPWYRATTRSRMNGARGRDHKRRPRYLQGAKGGKPRVPRRLWHLFVEQVTTRRPYVCKIAHIPVTLPSLVWPTILFTSCGGRASPWSVPLPAVWPSLGGRSRSLKLVVPRPYNCRGRLVGS